MFLDAPIPPTPTLLDVHARSWMFLDVAGRSYAAYAYGPGCSMDAFGCSWMLPHVP